MRVKNVKFFITLNADKTIRYFAKNADLSPQQATRLLKLWLNEGLVMKNNETPTRYKHTAKGYVLMHKLAAVMTT